MTEEKIQSLEQLRIHELRDLARKMGVSSPTTMKKEQIISEILAIMSGEVQPASNKTKQGRPPRNQKDDFSMVNFLVPKQEELNGYSDSKEYNLNDTARFSFVLNAPSPTYEADVDLDSVYDRAGLLDITPTGYGIIRKCGYMPSDYDVFVPANLIKKFDLKSGQYVSGKAKRIKEDRPEVLFNIDSVDIKKGRFVFDEKSSRLDQQYKTTGEQLPSQIKVGGRYICTNVDKNNIYSKCYQEAKSLQKLNPNADVKVLFVAGIEDMLPREEKLKYTNLPYYRREEDLVLGTNLFIERCKREVETGKNIILVMSGLTQLANAYNTMFLQERKFTETSPNMIHNLKRILSSSKTIDKDSSLTLVVFDTLRAPQNIRDVIEFELMDSFLN